MRSAAFNISNASNVLISDCSVKGFDDFAHVENSENIQITNSEHIPDTYSAQPDDDLSQLRGESPSITNRTASSKSFSFPPRIKNNFKA